MHSLAETVYRTARPSAGNRRTLRRLLQHYADLVICPRLQRHPSVGQLNAHRWYAAQQVIKAAPSIALDLAQMADSAPRELPFKFTSLDAWRIALDAQQAQGVAA
jgi:hypothetical protein